jgi:hypothetical protein
LPGACNGMPAGTSGSSGEMSGTASATTVTTITNDTATQFISDGGDFGNESRRTRPRANVPAGSAIAMSARLPLDTGDLVRIAGRPLEPNVEPALGARVDADRAAWVERAAGWRGQRAGGFARQYP